jgi:hypothetical protein
VRGRAAPAGNGHTRQVSDPLRAEDLLPLIAKLPRDQRVRLARLALAAAAAGDDGAAYAAHPVDRGELADGDDGLGWDGEGWDELAPSW